MLSKEANDICNQHFGGANYDEVIRNCEGCPLYPVCKLEVDELPGDTLEAKTAWLEEQMNRAAETV